MCREDNKIHLSWPQEQQDCQISSFLDQESIWSADQKTGVYIYRRKRVSVLITFRNATLGVVFPRKRVSLGDIFQEKWGLVIFGGTFLKCAGTTKLSVLLLNFSFSGPRKYLVRGPNNRSIIYRRKRVSVLMTLINATQGVVFPRKRVYLGDIFQKKWGLVIFGGTFLKCAGTTRLSVLLLNFSFS